MSIKIGDRVIIGSSHAYGNDFYNHFGCVRAIYPIYPKNYGIKSIGVKVDGRNHPNNNNGLYWFPEQDLIIVNKNVDPEPESLYPIISPAPLQNHPLMDAFERYCEKGDAITNPRDTTYRHHFEIKTVHFSGPCTVVVWADGTKTVVRCNKDDFYTPETGLAMAIAKRAYGNGNKARKVFEKWLPKEDTAINDSIALGFKKAIAALDRLSGALKETEEPDNE